MAQGSIHGKFVWQELTTEDPATAVSFYSKVVGWHAHANATHPTYTEFGIGSSHTAGMIALSDDARAAGVRSNWAPYIGVTDVDGTAAAAEKLGAKVVHPATDIAQVGRFATLNDPQGGVFALFKPSGQGPGGPAPTTIPVGDFAWLELATSDQEAAFAFYGKLFGWQVLQRMDMGPQGVYLIFGSDGVQRGGIYKMHAERSSRPYWLPYAEVPNADAAAAAAIAAGGRILVGPTDVPGGGRMAQVLDPSGAMFAVHSAGTVKAAAPSKPAAAKPAAPKPAAVKPVAAAPAAAKAPAPAASKPVASKPAVSKPAVSTPAASKPAASKAAPKKAAVKKAAAKKPAARKKAAAKKKPAARKKKAAARKSAARSSRKSAKRPARKSAAAKKKKSAKGRRAAGKARRKK